MGDPQGRTDVLLVAWIDADTGHEREIGFERLRDASLIPGQAPPAVTVGMALNAPELRSVVPSPLCDDALAGRLGLALHGLRARLDDVLEPGDRLELLTSLRVDAKAARRERVQAARASRGRSKWQPDWRHQPDVQRD